MAVLLISSIGNGYEDKDRRIHTYRTANYTRNAEDRNPIVTPYVFDAISQMNQVDKLVLIGTVGSDWLALYRFLCETKNIEPEDPVNLSLRTFFDMTQKYSVKPEEFLPNLEPIKALLQEKYNRVEIIILHYGIDEKELNGNFNLLTRIDEMVESGDEIIFDITHSFRSLSLFELIAVKYIKEIRKKQVSIQKVTYGMLEISRELSGMSPVIDLKPLITTLDLMTAIDEFERFGTTYALCDVLRELQRSGNAIALSDSAIQALRGLSENISINKFSDFAELVKESHRLVEDRDAIIGARPDLAMLVEKIFREINNRFYSIVESGDINMLRIRFAKWHYDKKRYVISALSVIETILSIACDITGVDENNSERREAYRDRLNRFTLNFPHSGIKVKKYRTLCGIYNKLRSIRNRLAHPTGNSIQATDINELCKELNRLNNFYTDNLLHSDSQVRAELAACLRIPVEYR